MMTIAFTLSMPNIGSWDGKWSGEERLYVLTRTVNNDAAAKLLKHKFHYYSFGDGWGAEVKVEAVDGRKGAQLRKKSKGFCGYDWMVGEILSHGRILTREERVGGPSGGPMTGLEIGGDAAVKEMKKGGK